MYKFESHVNFEQDTLSHDQCWVQSGGTITWASHLNKFWGIRHCTIDLSVVHITQRYEKILLKILRSKPTRIWLCFFVMDQRVLTHDPLTHRLLCCKLSEVSVVISECIKFRGMPNVLLEVLVAVFVSLPDVVFVVGVSAVVVSWVNCSATYEQKNQGSSLRLTISGQ
jgi:hypothetical protein